MYNFSKTLMNKFKSLLLLACFNSIISYGQWNISPTINTPVSIASKGQGDIHAAIDGNGGAILAWDDNRSSATNASDIYAQRMDKNGKAKWAANGTAICTNAGNQKSVNIIDAGNGSAIITWEDERSGNLDIYAQKIDSNGATLWAANGVAITTKLTAQKNPKIINDNAGGAIIVWEDSVNFYYDIYAQRINNSGTVQWTANGIIVCNASNFQINAKLDIDGAGGAIIAWQDKRNNNDYDIYVQHLDASGSALWKSNGVAICTSINTQSNPRIEPDGSKGAVIAWVDKRNGADYDVYAQQINSSGKIGWTANGVVICNASGNQSAIDLKYLGTTAAIVSWKDYRNNSYQIYSQMIDLQGKTLLTANGVLLSHGIQAINPNAISAGQGAAIIVWQDSTSAGWDIKSQKISKTGSIKNINTETTVCNAADDQINATNASDGQGGAIFVWEDHRNATDYDVYTHHLDSSGLSNAPAYIKFPQIYKTFCYPNPIINGHTSLTVISKNNPNQVVKIYNTLGSLLLIEKTDSEGKCMVNVSGLDNGIYYFKIESIDNSTAGNFLIEK